MEALVKSNIPASGNASTGKVRDIYKADNEHLLIVSTDRVSAFDHVFPNGIPGRESS